MPPAATHHATAITDSRLSHLLHTNPDSPASGQGGYPAPNKKEISQRVLSWQDGCYLANTADDPESMLAEDFMFGFDTANDVERRSLGLHVSQGMGPSVETREFVTMSLLRGAEQWDQMMACAESRRQQNLKWSHPLDGRDLLTYLAPLVVPELCHGIPYGAAEAAVGGGKQQDTASRGKRRGKRDAERDESHLPALRPQAKKPRVKKSHFWADPLPTRREQDTQLHETARPPTPKGTTGQDKSSIPTTADLTTHQTEESHNPISTPKCYSSRDNIFTVVTPQTNGTTTRFRHIAGPDFGISLKAQRSQTPSHLVLDSTAKEDHVPGPSEAHEANREDSPTPCTPKKRAVTSHFFAKPPLPKTPKKTKPPRGTVSSIPFPRLDAPCFGLIQEKLEDKPFHLLVAVTFLIKTKGTAAIPVFQEIMDLYPTPEELAREDAREDIMARIRHLGLGEVRTSAIQKYARGWLSQPPEAGKRFAVRGGYEDYPDRRRQYAGGEEEEEEGIIDHGDGGSGSLGANDERNEGEKKESKAQEGVHKELDAVLGPSSSSSTAAAPEPSNNRRRRCTRRNPTTPAPPAWEIGHLTQGRYALDSWRIFCRDALLGRRSSSSPHSHSSSDHPDPMLLPFPKDENGDFEPEWKRVLPLDKELRACLRWRWMREGWEWDPKTGQRQPLSERMRKAVEEGKVEWDNGDGSLVVVDDDDDDDGGGDAPQRRKEEEEGGGGGGEIKQSKATGN